mmetsp:Transcript_36309/g.50437  ORF Transcript_36309/g.50437 Transcript_36309/m.50437 type:complete len:229 (-) Transcript_36309:146-832(-)|eukprot:CAMPEP_0196584814 /NCGR_PEP_ID=MMETSP1081-20130531/48562_1 /TAXON_ID=36882 /ORGANISM="Pyramimonas amylifera, Strain CCMP720" /LENGTH=228 /DNA_ID=CAMNT_0041906157 /DNA_START=94 /DNA_END=780 /DNA_ORIENTATION=+
MSLKIGYWDIRGLGAPLRMMCAYAGEPYENKMYSEFPVWGAEKAEMIKKNPLMNLPYVVDGEKIICQSNACVYYLGKRLGIDGEDAETQLNIMQIMMQTSDLRDKIVHMVYPFNKVSPTQEDWDANLEKYLTQELKVYYMKFNSWMEFQKTKFSCADKVSSADFHLFEMIDQHELLFKSVGKESILKDFPKLSAFYEDFKSLPQLQEYFASDLHKLPCNNALGGCYFK